MSPPGAFLRPSSLTIPISRVRSSSPVRSPCSLRNLATSPSLQNDRPGTPRPGKTSSSNSTPSLNTDSFKFARRSSVSLIPPAFTSFLAPDTPDQGKLHARPFHASSVLDLARGRTDHVWGASAPKKRMRDPDTLGCRLSKEEVGKLEFYSRFTPTSISLGNFLEHRPNDNQNSLETAFNFLKREIPVRLANIMMEIQLLPDELLHQPACQVIMSQYSQSFSDVLFYENVQSGSEAFKDFNETLTNLRKRHQDTVPHMANALQGMKEAGKLCLSANDQQHMVIQYFLDRLYMSRISIHMLISHHKAHFCPEEYQNSPIGMTGTIDPNCDLAKVAEDAYESAAFLCESIYLDAPKLNLTFKDATSESENRVKFAYIPNHLHHMFFEVFKNSMRATMEFHDGKDKFPDVEVLIIKTKKDISIKISDQGGGISRKESDNVFQYLYTSANRATVSDMHMGGTTSVNTPMHGLGYGLPLSRLYARYFGGDMKQVSVHGFGTDTIIYLQALETDAKENLPIFNASSSNRIRNISNQVPEWTS